MKDYIEKIDRNIFGTLKNLKEPNILELEVQNGISTKKFIDLCNTTNGHLYSVDIDDCSSASTSDRWTFIKSRDDNFEFIKDNIPKELDVIYIDTLHEAKHVEKILYGYYDLLKVDGYIFVDDISHLPYIKNSPRNNFYCEINNQETFNKILEIYNENQKNIDLNFSFFSSGTAIIKKNTSNNLLKNKSLALRQFSIKNIIRLLWKSLKRD